MSLSVLPASMVASNRIWSFAPAVGDTNDEPMTQTFIVTSTTPWVATSNVSWIVITTLSSTSFKVTLIDPNTLGYGGRAHTGRYAATIVIQSSLDIVSIPVIFNIGWGDSLDSLPFISTVVSNIVLPPPPDLNNYYINESGAFLLSEDGIFFIIETGTPLPLPLSYILLEDGSAILTEVDDTPFLLE